MQHPHEDVPLLADDEERYLAINHPPPKKWDKEAHHNAQLPVLTTKSWLHFQTWKVVLWSILSTSPGFLLVAFLVLRRRQLPAVGSEIRIRHPPQTLPGWPPKNNPAYLVHARHGAVATENILCSDIGVDVLKDGGNAVDASVAATLCIGVVNMFRYGRFSGSMFKLTVHSVLE